MTTRVSGRRTPQPTPSCSIRSHLFRKMSLYERKFCYDIGCSMDELFLCSKESAPCSARAPFIASPLSFMIIFNMFTEGEPALPAAAVVSTGVFAMGDDSQSDYGSIDSAGGIDSDDEPIIDDGPDSAPVDPYAEGKTDTGEHSSEVCLLLWGC